MKHKHAEVIKSYIDGIQCEYWSNELQKWGYVTQLETFDWANVVRVKPEPKPKEYYDEDTFDIQYLYVYNDTKNGVMRFISKKIINLIDWEYMGKVRLEK